MEMLAVGGAFRASSRTPVGRVGRLEGVLPGHTLGCCLRSRIFFAADKRRV